MHESAAYFSGLWSIFIQQPQHFVPLSSSSSSQSSYSPLPCPLEETPPTRCSWSHFDTEDTSAFPLQTRPEYNKSAAGWWVKSSKGTFCFKGRKPARCWWLERCRVGSKRGRSEWWRADGWSPNTRSTPRQNRWPAPSAASLWDAPAALRASLQHLHMQHIGTIFNGSKVWGQKTPEPHVAFWPPLWPSVYRKMKCV